MCMSNEPQNQTWTVDTEPTIRSIDDVELTELRLKPILKFLIAFGVGGFFFLLPVTWHGQITVPFDIAVSIIIETFPDAVGVYALGIIIAGGLLTTVAECNQRDILSLGWDVSYFESSSVFWALRVIGVVLAPIMFFKLGPGWLHTGSTGEFIWNTLIYSVAVIIPIGAIFVTIFVELGGLEFIGTLSRPFMRPLFKVPGRAALDSLASWVGSYSVGLYVTRNVFEQGGYPSVLG
jgi:nucleoside recognition membrane protein YjiH